MPLFTENEILEATGGISIGVPADLTQGERSVASLSTDTRTIEPDALFVALVGERFDGHIFCRTAYEKGASLLLISDEHMLPEGAAGILVSDTLTALHALARAYRRKLGCKVIAVTGSVGKTSTREMLYAALSHSLRTHATKHNLNNDIGLPLTILSAPADTELLIVEMGMRMRGEIRTLTRIAEPDIAVITNIGVSHIERLGSREEILLSKMEICEGLTGDKLLLINGEDRLLSEYTRNAAHVRWNRLGATAAEADSASLEFADQAVTAADIAMTAGGTTFRVRYRAMKNGPVTDLGMIHLPCMGAHHVKNALFAAACAMYLGVSMEDVKKGLCSYMPTGSRGRVIETNNYILYDDAYNASPESMAASFESVRVLSAGRRKIAAVGGILELGSYAAEQHFKVGLSAAASGMDLLFVCGDNREDVKAGALSMNRELPVFLFSSRDELTEALLAELKKGDVILVKGSHAFEMEKVTQAVMDFDNTSACAGQGGEARS